MSVQDCKKHTNTPTPPTYYHPPLPRLHIRKLTKNDAACHWWECLSAFLLLWVLSLGVCRVTLSYNGDAMLCFYPARFPHVRDVLAEALRLLSALGAAGRCPLDSVIPGGRHEHCNPSGSHHTRYVLLRHGCRIGVSVTPWSRRRRGGCQRTALEWSCRTGAVAFSTGEGGELVHWLCERWMHRQTLECSKNVALWRLVSLTQEVMKRIPAVWGTQP